MEKTKIVFEISNEENNIYFTLPENLNTENKMIASDKIAFFLTALQTGQFMSSIIHSLIENSIINNDKNFSDLIIKKLLNNFYIQEEEKPVISPTEAFLFKEKQ